MQLKELCNLIKLSVNIRVRIKFLNSCFKLGLVPPHLYKFTKVKDFSPYNSNSYKRLENIQLKFVKTIMRLELKDAYSYLHITRVILIINISNIFNISNTIPVVLPASKDDEFFKYLDHISGSYFLEQMNKIT